MTKSLDRLVKLLEKPLQFDEFVLSLQTEQWREGFMVGVNSYQSLMQRFLETIDDEEFNRSAR
jgi:ATP adenylyltransferase/5',5'''-P-1,P-4-tetraphosphate phosphorylase II